MMNRPQRKIPQPKPSSAVEPALFIAWNRARELADNRAEAASNMAEQRVALSPVTARQRDRRLWHFRSSEMSRDAWFGMHAELALTSPSWHMPTRPVYAAAKLCCDVVGSLVLLVLLLPVFLLVALLIRFDSPGPVFFRQRRIGKDGEEFLLWKFRSMYVDAPAYARSPTSGHDRRMTRFGRLIRRISIDELPQLINVLKGEMSLVGPRPEMPFIVAGYTPFERRRLAVKPGITGLWQVSPARALPIHQNLQYDLHYIRHRSFMLDGAILLRTVAAVVRGVGAV